MSIVTPLTYGDAITLVAEVLDRYDTGRHGILLRDGLAHVLMAVDVASREQARQTAEPAEPIEVVCDRIREAGERFLAGGGK